LNCPVKSLGILQKNLLIIKKISRNIFLIKYHSLLGLICVSSVVCLFRESKFLASATFWLEQEEKFTLRTARAEGTFQCGLAEKSWCWLVVIPVLVFDCVALQFREGISGLFF